MKQSQLFTKTQKEAPKDKASRNAELLVRAGFIDKLMAGVYTMLPLGYKALKNVENIIREEMNAIGGQEMFMPTLHPKENWKKTGRWDTMDDLYKVKDSSDREFALGATHEEVIVPLMKRFVSSYKDLPFAAYQFQNKFRMELRAKSGILRGREFMMKDLYSFHTDEEDVDQYYEKVKDAYFEIFKRCGIGKRTHLTFAPGGSFAKYSHEFQTTTEAGEDVISICKSCNLAINKEIKEETPKCPECGGEDFQEKKAVEVGNIFKLKNKYTKPFELSVTGKDGEKKDVVMGCYGIGIQRLLGTVVEVCNDEKGIIWPEEVAPFKVHLIDLREEEKAEEIYNQLISKGVDVLWDDRDASPGEKFADSDLIGIPHRVVISKKSLESGGVEVKKRNEDKAEIMKIEEFIEKVN